MERKLLKTQFTKDRIPAWFCPTCKSGVLLPKKDGFIYYETAISKINQKHPDWEPEWEYYTYALILECSNKSCKEIVSSTGIGSIEMDYEYGSDGDVEQIFSDTFTPKYFYPPLILFNFPDELQDDIKNELMQSFELFFCNPPSSANHIRVALEKLLNHLKVKQYEIIKGRKRFISLHKRIEIISTKYRGLKEDFLALKWLGNAGSHSHKIIMIDDVITSFSSSPYLSRF
jgi:hypothetical protein